MTTKKIIWLCLGGVAALAIFVGALIFSVERMFHESAIYQMSLDRVTAEKQVIDSIGQPMKAKWFISGSLEASIETGYGDFYYNVVGPKGNCEVYVTGHKRGTWKIT